MGRMSDGEHFLVMLLIVLLIIILWLNGCSFLPTLHHPRSSHPEIDFTKPPPEIPEQYDLTPL